MMIDTINLNRLSQLKALLVVIADAIDKEPGARDLASLAKQYRETIKEIEEIEGQHNDGDEIAEILAERDAAGKTGAVR